MKRTLILLVAVLVSVCGVRSQNDDRNIYQTFEEHHPEFPGGVDSLQAFIERNLYYPKEALDYHIEGRVYIFFIVEKDGRLSNPLIFRGLPGGCSQMAMKLVKRMPRWKPGEQRDSSGNYRPVRVSYPMPVNFTLDPQSPHLVRDYDTDTTDIHYPGGTDALYRYLATHIDYPREHWTSKVSTTVFFDSTGQVERVKIGSPVEPEGLADAIANALEAMPRWIPGKMSHNETILIPIDLPLLASMHDTLLRPYYFEVTDQVWQHIIAHEAYFRQVLAVNDSLTAGYAVPAERLQALAPRDESHYQTLCGVDYYTHSGHGMDALTAMLDLAVEDSLDMMEHFIHMFDWCDGYVAELIYDYAIEVEQRNPEKFRRLMQQICPDRWEGFVEWRDEYLKWKNENK